MRHRTDPILLLSLVLLGALAPWTAAATGGPDSFGYTFIDSLEPAGPSWTGIDITATGAAFAGGDDVMATVTLGRPFQLYDEELTEIHVASNGFIASDDTGAGDATNDCPLPAVPDVGGGARIYVLHDDLITTTFFVQYFAACPRTAEHGSGTVGCTIVQWDGVSHFPGSPVASWDQWAYLYDNGDIVIEVGPGNPETGSDSTTGLQDDTGADGLNIACNTPASVPGFYAALFSFPCDQALGVIGGLPPPTTSLTVSGPTTIDAAEGTINGILDPAYRGGGIFSFIDITIQPTGTLTCTGATAPDLRATGTITIDGTINLDGSTGAMSNNGQPGGALTPGVAGGGSGGVGGCGHGWQARDGMRGGGSTGGFGGSHPAGSGGFADVTGGGGGGNGTTGTDGAPPIGAFPTEPGRGGCANLAPLVAPLRGGGGGGGGGCDVDAGTPVSTGTQNDGGSAGGSGGGAIRFEAAGNLTVGPTGNITADGGNGGDNGGNGAAGGGGAGGTILLISAADLTFDGLISATGGSGGAALQASAGAVGGPGGDGIVGFWDSDGVIAGTGASTPAPITGTSPVFLTTDLSIANLDLPNASPSQPYTGTVLATGGSGAYTFSVSAGALPAGLTLAPGTGLITGSSTSTPGTRSEFTITVDDGSTTYDRAFCILTRINSLAITTTSVLSADTSTAYSDTITVAGGAGGPTFQVHDGALPTGLALNPATGAITGTTGPDPEMATFVVSVEDAVDEVDSLTYVLSVGGPGASPVVAPPPPAQECIAYSETLIAGGGTPPHSYEILGGALPPGFALNPVTGVITGTPAVGDSAGSPYSVCLYVYDAVGMVGSLTVDFIVDPPPVLPPACDILGPVTPPAAGGAIALPITPMPTCPGTVEVVSVEYSLDGGVTFLGPCTPTASSPIVPPQAGVPSGGPTDFIWSSAADGVALMTVESSVVVRATVSDPAGTGTCTTMVFEVDNQCLCGDCNGSGALPPTILDALEAARISAGLVTPTSLQVRCCDVNASTSVSITDALLMAQSAAGIPATLTCP